MQGDADNGASPEETIDEARPYQLSWQNLSFVSHENHSPFWGREGPILN